MALEPWVKLRHVTIPMISPAILFNLIVGALRRSSSSQGIRHRQGVAGVQRRADRRRQNSLLFYGLNLYNAAFRYFQMGYASALAWVLLVIILLATFLMLRVVPKPRVL